MPTRVEEGCPCARRLTTCAVRVNFRHGVYPCSCRRPCRNNCKRRWSPPRRKQRLPRTAPLMARPCVESTVQGHLDIPPADTSRKRPAPAVKAGMPPGGRRLPAGEFNCAHPLMRSCVCVSGSHLAQCLVDVRMGRRRNAEADAFANHESKHGVKLSPSSSLDIELHRGPGVRWESAGHGH